MKEAIIGALAGLHPLVRVAIISALPIFEVRGGIPMGIYWQVPFVELLPVAIVSNVLIVVPLLLWFNPVADWLIERGILTGLLRRLIARARARKPMVDRHGVWAITLFVAIPLPVTGAWTGAMVASVFHMNFWRALLCMVLGVMIASAVVTALSLAGFYTYQVTTG